MIGEKLLGKGKNRLKGEITIKAEVKNTRKQKFKPQKIEKSQENR